MIDEKFILVGAVLNIIGSFTYLRDTIRGKTKPNRMTWFLWALAPLIAFAAELRHGVGLPSLMTFMVGFGPLLIFCASFVNRRSVWKLTPLDVACGILSVSGLFLWGLTGSGYMAIICSIAADAFAAIPTIIKAYKAPETESWLVFLFGGTSAAIVLLTLDSWGFAFYAFPLYILTVCAVLVALIRFRLGVRFRQPQAAPAASQTANDELA